MTTYTDAEMSFFGEEDIDLSKPPILPPAVAALVARNPDVQTLNAVAVKLIGVLDDPQSSASTVDQALRADVGLATRILRTANSSFYGAASDVSSVRQAVARVGFESVRAIALAAAMADDNRMTSPLGAELARHSIAVGVLSRLLAHHQKNADPDLCFIAGLLHDVGKFVFLQAAPAAYEPIIETAVSLDWRFCETERARFGCDHADLGASMAYGWGLHPRILMGIRLHHQLSTLYSADLDPYTQSLVATVRLADDIFRGQRTPGGDLATELQPVDGEARDLLSLSDAALATAWEDFQSHYPEACAVLL